MPEQLYSELGIENKNTLKHLFIEHKLSFLIKAVYIWSPYNQNELPKIFGAKVPFI